MKNTFLVSCLVILMYASPLPAADQSATVAIGDSIPTVVEKLGKPNGIITGKQRSTYYYEQGTIDFMTGRVHRVWLVSGEEARQRTARREQEERNRIHQEENERKRLTEAGDAELAKIQADKSFLDRSPADRLDYWTQFAKRYPYTDIATPMTQTAAAVTAEQKKDDADNELVTLNRRAGAIQERFKTLDSDYAASLANWKRTEISTERAKLKEELAAIETRVRELTPGK
jgi:vacuolar-type H+-ATPase subunit I/STV1